VGYKLRVSLPVARLAEMTAELPAELTVSVPSVPGVDD
jgi:hypothetical protein